jgi:RNA polymerase sigma-70 factor (ECF subfamily)
MAGEPAASGNIDDKTLMLKFQEQGEMSAFETLFARHRLHLLRYLRKLARSADVAEEVSQQTWLKVIEAARDAKYNPELRNTFGTWLFTLARNYYLDRHVRAHGVKKRVSNSSPEANLDEITTCVDAAEGLHRDGLTRILQAAIDRLPFEQREVLLLWAHGHDLTAIAEICAAPWATIVSRKKYALAKLRTELMTFGIAAGDT